MSIISEKKSALTDMSKRKTTPYATIYEYSEFINARSLQLGAGDEPKIQIVDDQYDPLIIAKKEVDQKLLSLVIRRELPDGSTEDWRMQELIFPEL